MTPSPISAPQLSAQQQFILESFNSQTYVENRMNIQDTPLYDTVVLAAAATISPLTSVLFTNVGPQAGKTLALTNMATPQKLNAPQAFSIFSFTFRYSENIDLLDIWNVLNGFCYEFWMADKAQQRAPIWCHNAGGGIYGIATASQTTIMNNGMPGRSDMHRLGINLVIENQASFYALLNGNAYVLNAGGTGITFQSVLRGLYAFGVS
jgi:hypothetical protein